MRRGAAGVVLTAAALLSACSSSTGPQARPSVSSAASVPGSASPRSAAVTPTRAAPTKAAPTKRVKKAHPKPRAASSTTSMPAMSMPARATSSHHTSPKPAPHTSSKPTPRPVHSSSPASVPAGAIVIKNYGFSGGLSVRSGQVVTVVNQDSVPHTLTDKLHHKFDTGNIAAGGRATFTAPTKPGRYAFGCTYHPDMAGTLVVS
jgi:plastocyanin